MHILLESCKAISNSMRNNIHDVKINVKAHIITVCIYTSYTVYNTWPNAFILETVIKIFRLRVLTMTNNFGISRNMLLRTLRITFSSSNCTSHSYQWIHYITSKHFKMEFETYHLILTYTLSIFAMIVSLARLMPTEPRTITGLELTKVTPYGRDGVSR